MSRQPAPRRRRKRGTYAATQKNAGTMPSVRHQGGGYESARGLFPAPFPSANWPPARLDAGSTALGPYSGPPLLLLRYAGAAGQAVASASWLQSPGQAAAS